MCQFCNGEEKQKEEEEEKDMKRHKKQSLNLQCVSSNDEPVIHFTPAMHQSIHSSIVQKCIIQNYNFTEIH